MCSKVYRFRSEPPTVLVPRAIVKHAKSLAVGERLTAVASVIATAILAALTHHIWVLFESWTLCRGLLCVVGQIAGSHPLSSGTVHTVADVTMPNTSCGDVIVLLIQGWYHYKKVKMNCNATILSHNRSVFVILSKTC